MFNERLCEFCANPGTHQRSVPEERNKGAFPLEHVPETITPALERASERITQHWRATSLDASDAGAGSAFNGSIPRLKPAVNSRLVCLSATCVMNRKGKKCVTGFPALVPDPPVFFSPACSEGVLIPSALSAHTGLSMFWLLQYRPVLQFLRLSM